MRGKKSTKAVKSSITLLTASHYQNAPLLFLNK